MDGTARLGRAFGLIGLAAAAAADGQAQERAPAAGGATALDPIEVVAISPVGGTGSGAGVDRSKIAGTVESLFAPDLMRDRSPSLVETLGQRVPGAHLTDVQGNEFTQDLRYRGFAASPLQGTPQGLAVYQNGIRLNEAFGDTLNWDLVLPIAIRSIDVFSNNPVFGLNALGGAVNIETKNGFTYQGSEIQVRAGSFGRIETAFQSGHRSGPWGLYVAGDALRDGGWRYESLSRLARVHADLGYKVPGAELHLIASGAKTRLGVIGPTPVDLLFFEDRAIYTWPQVTRNEAGSVALTGKFDLTSTWTLQSNVYFRQFRQNHLDGNVAEFEGCSASSSFEGQICLQDDGFPVPPGGKTAAFRDRFALLGPSGATIPFTDGVAYGTIDRTFTQSRTIGSSVQATNTDRIAGHGNTFVVGASLDHSDIVFRSESVLGTVYPNLFVAPDPDVPGTGLGPIRTLGDIGYAPVSLSAASTYYGFYALDTFDVTDRLSLSAGGRFNIARIDTADTGGSAPELNGSHTFRRFNPVVGMTFKIVPEASLYAGYSEANRAPTPLELNCADPNRPCLLANSLVADPPLKQVVAHTYEAGLRGTVPLPDEGKLTWKAGLFRTDSIDDIIAIASTIQGRGYFANVPATRRQGVEAAAQYRNRSWLLYADYTFLDATFRFTDRLASPNNPAADANGEILVRYGARIPLVPRHQVKAGFDYFVTPEWKVGADLAAFSSQFYAGDESNQGRKLPAFWRANLHSSYQINQHVQVFVEVRNLLNARYPTYGTFLRVDALGGAIPIALNDPRSLTLAQPRSVYGGVKVTW